MIPTYCCRNCIAALQSRGEKYAIITNLESQPEKNICEWCEEEDDDLKPVIFL